MKKQIVLGVLLVSTLLLGGCKAKEENPTTTNPVNLTPTIAPTKTVVPTATPTVEVTPTTAPTEIIKKTSDELKEIALKSVFNVKWECQDGEYTAGTSSCVTTDFTEQPILITAFHYFWPDDAEEFTGTDLVDYVLGGELYDILTGEKAGVKIKDVIEIKDAMPVPEVNKDLAAFYLDKPEEVVSFEFAEAVPQQGDKIYLLAALWDTDIPEESCIYEGEVLFVQDGILYYYLDEAYGTNGASGAPLVNGDGEIVGLHMGSSTNGIRFGHAADSVQEMLKDALEK